MLQGSTAKRVQRGCWGGPASSKLRRQVTPGPSRAGSKSYAGGSQRCFLQCSFSSCNRMAIHVLQGSRALQACMQGQWQHRAEVTRHPWHSVLYAFVVGMRA